MSDPLSSAASVAGLVSLGLQVYSGVSKYLDAVQGRDGDLESARQNAKNLEDTVRFIEQFVPQLQANHQVHATAVSKCVQSCQIQLASLQDLLRNLGSSPTLNGSFWNNARDRKKQLAYPFHRSNLERLESRLGKVNATLQTTLQVLELREQQATNTMLAGIETVSRDTPVQLRRMSNEIAAASSTLRAVDNALPSMQDAVAALEPLFTIKADETSTQLARMESSIVSSMLVHQALLATAVSAADQRNRAHEKNLNALRNLLLRRLVSVPSALKDLSNELVSSQTGTLGRDMSVAREEQLQAPASSLTASHIGCLCRVRRSYQGKQTQWGPLRFYNQEFVEESHLPGCPRRNFTKTRSKQTYGVTYTGLVSIINRAIDLSFSMCFGAGGWSISREFRCISTVDDRSAPVFRLLDDLLLAIDLARRPSTQENTYDLMMKLSEWKDLLNSVLGKIRWLFDNRLGSPDDVNAMNQTVMSSVLDIIFRASSIRCCYDEKVDIVDNLMKLVELVRYYDVPVFSYDNAGHTAFIDIFNLFPEHPSWTAPVIDMITSSASEILPITSHKLGNRWSYREPLYQMVSAFEVSQTYAECWGCGPLSLAIVAGDVAKAGRILQKFPTLLKETNLLEQTPFHLAAGKPACLSLLLKALQPADLHLLDHEDVTENSALVYAIAFSLKQCRSNSSTQKCRRCTCASCLVMLLRTNACSLHLKTILRDLFSKHASLRCKIKFINHLKRRGGILKKLAFDSSCWTTADTEACNLNSTNVLGAHATSVINILKTHGVRIANSAESPWYDDCSVYHCIGNTADAEEFYRRGFRDVAVPNNKGILPLDEPLLPSCLSWLVEHGASLTPVLQRSTKSILEDPRCRYRHRKSVAIAQSKTHAHAIAFRTGYFATHRLADLSGGDFRKEERSIKRLSTSILPADNVDDCKCPCSDRGCTPWIDMLKGLCGETGYQDRDANSVPIMAARFSAFLRMSHELFEPSQLRAAIRFLTFSGLGMTHVCCWPCTYAVEKRPDFHRLYTRQEAHEIRELEGTELHILENLVFEFSERLDTQYLSFSADLTALEDFWHQHWVPRMEETLEDLKGAIDYETDIKGAEEVGVIWERPADEEGDEITRYAYWANRIDKIMEDARELLKTKNC